MRRGISTAIVALVVFAGCGDIKEPPAAHYAAVSARQVASRPVQQRAQVVSAWVAGDAAVARDGWFAGLAAWSYIRGVVRADAATSPQSARELPSPTGSLDSEPEVDPAVPVGSGDTLACIASAESENGANMDNGPTWWTRFGLITGIITEYGTPEQQAAVFGGYATYEQELDIAARFTAAEGFGGFGVLTRAKCGL